MTKSSASSGFSLSAVLGVVFIVLKLTGVITWSWGWVLAPLWLPTVLLVVVFILTTLIAKILGKK